MEKVNNGEINYLYSKWKEDKDSLLKLFELLPKSQVFVEDHNIKNSIDGHVNFKQGESISLEHVYYADNPFLVAYTSTDILAFEKGEGTYYLAFDFYELIKMALEKKSGIVLNPGDSNYITIPPQFLLGMLTNEDNFDYFVKNAKSSLPEELPDDFTGFLKSFLQRFYVVDRAGISLLTEEMGDRRQALMLTLLGDDKDGLMEVIKHVMAAMKHYNIKTPLTLFYSISDAFKDGVILVYDKRMFNKPSSQPVKSTAPIFPGYIPPKTK